MVTEDREAMETNHKGLCSLSSAQSRAAPLHDPCHSHASRRPIVQIKMLQLRRSATCPRPHSRAGIRSPKGLGFLGLPGVSGQS